MTGGASVPTSVGGVLKAADPAQAAQLARGDARWWRTLQDARLSQGRMHAVGGPREVELCRLDAGSFGDGIGVVGVLLGSQEATAAELRGAVGSALAANATTMERHLVFLLSEEVAERRKAGRRVSGPRVV